MSHIYSLGTLVLALGLLLCQQSCSTETTVLRCANGPNPSGTGCASSAPGTSDIQDDSDAGVRRDDSTPMLTDTTPSIIEDIVGTESEDIEAADVRIDGVCIPGTDPMDRPMGQPCTDHTQCGTCYCYDEAYMSATGFRFCTKECLTGPGSACDTGNLISNIKYACLIFTSTLIKDYDLKRESICAVECQSVEECQISGGAYNHCPQGETQWDGVTLQATPTCQVTQP